jgi:universal stress protein A
VELELRRVLVSTDFSEVGDRAIGIAFRLAADHGASVTLVHVMERAVVPNPLYAHYHPLPSSEQQKQAEEATRTALAERVPAAYRDRVAHEIAVDQGEPAEEIVRRAGEMGADLLVISGYGQQGVVRLVLGSVAQRVVSRAPCPVLLVR